MGIPMTFSPRRPILQLLFTALLCGCAIVLSSANAGAQSLAQQPFDFRADPNWEGFRNRLLPAKLPKIEQNFGYRTTNHAGGTLAGEIGGVIQRASIPATYARAIPKLTLDDRLTASGKFVVNQAEGGSGAMVGWFRHDSRGWRTPNSLGFRIDGNGGKYWLFYEYGTRHHQTGGGGAFEGDRYQTTQTKPFPAGNTVHEFALDYDPAANEGHGVLTFTIDGKTWEQVKLPPGHQEDGAEFDRFGIWNVQIPGAPLELYLDDLVVNGEKLDFTNEPKWIGSGNHVRTEERMLRPFHDFGFTNTNNAGGETGEIGGTIFRDEKPSYYAAKTERLSLDNELRASGKISLNAAASDSGVMFGWFDSESKRNKEDAEYVSRQKNYLALVVEGPSRVGHWFRPAYSSKQGTGLQAGPETYGGKEPPVIPPDGKPHEWSMHYNPRGAGGNGSITVTFDESTQTLELRPGDRATGAAFDRFGFFNLQAGGHYVQIYVDDLQFTAGP